MRRFALVAGLALVLALGLAGCGGDGDDRLSREEYVEQATALCDDAEDRLRQLGSPQSIEELEAYAGEAQTVAGDTVAELRELTPPESLEDGLDRYIERVEEVIGMLDELEQAAASGDAAEASRLAGEIGDSTEAEEAAQAAGIPACESEDEE
jgi:hypothetical protein